MRFMIPKAEYFVYPHAVYYGLKAFGMRSKLSSVIRNESDEDSYLEITLDKFRDECGVFGIYGHADAARLTYLGLYALQHRGQESCGIVSANGSELRQERAMGHVADAFDQAALDRLDRRQRDRTRSLFHRRRSFNSRSATVSGYLPARTDRRLSQRQPAFRSRRATQTRAEGAIFSATSDTEVILHGVARSKAASVREAIPEVLRNTEGAFSMLFLTPTELIAIRDPRGFRPLALGRLGDAWVVASETCAFDLIDAQYVRDVEPGEMMVIDEDGLRSSHPLRSTKTFDVSCSSTSILRDRIR